MHEIGTNTAYPRPYTTYNHIQKKILFSFAIMSFGQSVYHTRQTSRSSRHWRVWVCVRDCVWLKVAPKTLSFKCKILNKKWSEFMRMKYDKYIRRVMRMHEKWLDTEMIRNSGSIRIRIYIYGPPMCYCNLKTTMEMRKESNENKNCKTKI